MQELAKLMKQHYPSYVNSQTDLRKIKSAKLVGNNLILAEMENGSTRIFRLEDDKVSIYGTKEVLRDEVFPVFKSIFRGARINSIMEEEI